MTVTMTSPAYGKAVGETYTGPEEAWLLAEGYATQAAYVGPGVSETGPAGADPEDDPTLASNREDQPWPEAANFAGPRDPAMGFDDPADPAYDFDPGGVNDEAPVISSLTPATGAAAGGDEVTIEGLGFEGVTGVTFDGVAGTDLSVTDDGELVVTTPAHAAGAVDVVVTNPNGSDTEVGGFTYA